MNYDQTPKCCKNCRNITGTKRDVKCKLGVMIPVKKKACVKQALEIKPRFFKFLRDEGVLDEWVKNVKEYHDTPQKVHPLDYILCAFPWPPRFDKNKQWSDLSAQWNEIIRTERPDLYRKYQG